MIKKIAYTILSVLFGYFIVCFGLGMYAMHLWAQNEDKSIANCMQKTGYTYEQCEKAVIW